jgi:hypothetical protein
LDKKNGIILCLFIITQIIVVLVLNRSNIGSLIVFFGSVLFYIFPLIFKTNHVNQNKQTITIWFAFLLVLTIVYGIIQHITGYFIWDKNWGKFSPTGMDIVAMSNWGHFHRAFSFFSGLQEFAIFIIFTILLLWTSINGMPMKILLCALLLTGLYIAGAKSMILSLPVAFISYYIRKKITPFVLFFSLFILPYIIIILVYVSIKDTLIGHLSMMTGLFDFGTILPRLENIYMNLSTLNSIFTVFGAGVNTPGSFMDNMYITILWETGFPGLILFMLLIYKEIKRLHYIEKEDKIYPMENAFLHIVFISMTLSMHSGPLLLSRFSIIVFIYIIICINKKYEIIKNNTFIKEIKII